MLLWNLVEALMDREYVECSPFELYETEPIYVLMNLVPPVLEDLYEALTVEREGREIPHGQECLEYNRRVAHRTVKVLQSLDALICVLLLPAANISDFGRPFFARCPPQLILQLLILVIELLELVNLAQRSVVGLGDQVLSPVREVFRPLLLASELLSKLSKRCPVLGKAT